MGSLYIPGKREVKGPWLLSTNELEALDPVLEIIEQNLAEASEKFLLEDAKHSVSTGDFPSLYPDIDTALSRKREYYLGKNTSTVKCSKIITITSKDGKQLTGVSMKEIIKHSYLQNFMPESLNIDIKAIAGNNFFLKVARTIDGELRYNVDCYDQTCKDDVIFAIDSWIDKYRPSKQKQIWSNKGFFFIFLGFIWAGMLLPSVISIQSPDYKPIYKKELSKLLKLGITKETQPKAIELYIKYNIDYLPEEVQGKESIEINYQWLRVVAVLILIAVASIFRPKTTIGLGNYKFLVERYNNYTRFIFVTIPASIIIPPLIDFIKKLAGL